MEDSPIIEVLNDKTNKQKLLYNCKAKFEGEKSVASLHANERHELLRLRKENKELRMEKDILKKASAILLKEIK